MLCASSAGFRNPGLDPLAQTPALKLGKDRQHPGHGSPRGRGEVQGFAQGNKTDAQLVQLLERAHEVSQGASPPVQAPDHNRIDLAAPRRPHQLLTLQPLVAPRTDIFNHGDDCSAALLRVRYHGVALEREGLLIMGRDSGVEAHLHHAGSPGQKPLHNAAPRRLIYKPLDGPFVPGHKLFFCAREGRMGMPLSFSSRRFRCSPVYWE
jgi:hypothetical protein